MSSIPNTNYVMALKYNGLGCQMSYKVVACEWEA